MKCLQSIAGMLMDKDDPDVVSWTRFLGLSSFVIWLNLQVLEFCGYGETPVALTTLVGGLIVLKSGEKLPDLIRRK